MDRSLLDIANERYGLMEFNWEVRSNSAMVRSSRQGEEDTEMGGSGEAGAEGNGTLDDIGGTGGKQMWSVPTGYGTGPSFSGVSKEAAVEALRAVQWVYDGERIGERTCLSQAGGTSTDTICLRKDDLVWRVLESLNTFYRVTGRDFKTRDASETMHARLLMDIGMHHCTLKVLERLRRWQYEPTRRMNLWRMGEWGVDR